MPGQKPNIVEIYRIVHIDNMDYLLAHGMFTKDHANADPNYRNIGDTILIQQRTTYPVRIAPNGVLGDYVPFYFGPLSPMLLNIKTGHRGITQLPQSDIVYIVCEISTIFANCNSYCFTNGHGKDNMTEFYNSPDDLDKVDWEIVRERYWRNKEDDLDRQRRKQAEFLVKDHVPVNCINRIIVYNAPTKAKVEHLLARLHLSIPVVINLDYYY